MGMRDYKQRQAALLALSMLMAADVDAFQAALPRAHHRHRINVRTKSAVQLQAFATDVYLNNLYQSPALTDQYYSSQEIYLENMAQTFSMGVGTTATADVEALRETLWQNEDLMTRISMAAEFSGADGAACVAGATMTQATTDVMNSAAAMVTDGLPNSAMPPPPPPPGPAVDFVASAADMMHPPPGPVIPTTDSLLTTATDAAASMMADHVAPAVTQTVAQMAAEATTTTTTPDAAAATVDVLRNQLSDVAYSVSEPAMTTASSKAAGLAGLSQTLEAAFSNYLMALSNTGEAAAKTGSAVWGGAMATAQGVSNGVNFVANAPSQVAANTQASFKMVTNDWSISEVAGHMVDGVLYLGKMIISIINIIIEAVSGETVADLANKAQMAAAGLTSNAAASVAHTLHNIGEMSVVDALQSIAKVIVLVTTVLYRIFSGIIEVVSGKNVAEWGSIAVKGVEYKANQMLMAIGNTASDLSHKSITELVAMLSNLEQHVSHSVMNAATQVVDSTDASMALASLQATMQ